MVVGHLIYKRESLWGPKGKLKLTFEGDVVLIEAERDRNELGTKRKVAAETWTRTLQPAELYPALKTMRAASEEDWNTSPSALERTHWLQWELLLDDGDWSGDVQVDCPSSLELLDAICQLDELLMGVDG